MRAERRLISDCYGRGCSHRQSYRSILVLGQRDSQHTSAKLFANSKIESESSDFPPAIVEVCENEISLIWIRAKIALKAASNWRETADVAVYPPQFAHSDEGWAAQH